MEIDVQAKRAVVIVQLQQVATQIVELDRKRQDLANQLKKLEGALELLNELEAMQKEMVQGK